MADLLRRLMENNSLKSGAAERLAPELLNL
jgi:hypothetical protein